MLQAKKGSKGGRGMIEVLDEALEEYDDDDEEEDDDFTSGSPKSLSSAGEKWSSREDSEEDGAGGEYARAVSEALAVITSEITSEITSAVTSETLSLPDATVGRGEAGPSGEMAPEAGLSGVRGALKKVLANLAEGLVSREPEVRVLLLAALSREHLLLLGPPGTAKSVLGSRLASLCAGRFFSRLLTRFTTPEELFGPLSLAALENDEYLRKTEGYLPTSEVAFLDEVFKANSAILNTLLTLLNERVFDNGPERQKAPLLVCVAASNERPDTEELDALYDRFLFRREVLPVRDDQVMELLEMVSGTAASAKPPPAQAGALDINRVVQQIEAAMPSVRLPREQQVLLRRLRAEMRDSHQVLVPDRRLVKTAHALRVSAASHARSAVNALDLLAVLPDTFWVNPEERGIIRAWLWENLVPEAEEGPARLLLRSLLTRALEALRATAGEMDDRGGAKEVDVRRAASLVSEAGALRAAVTERRDALRGHIADLERAGEHLWLDPTDAVAAQQALRPVAEERLAMVMRTLTEVASLEKALEGGLEGAVRLGVVERLEERARNEDPPFEERELAMTMREAKAAFDVEKFRLWKRAKKRSEKYEGA